MSELPCFRFNRGRESGRPAGKWHVIRGARLGLTYTYCSMTRSSFPWRVEDRDDVPRNIYGEPSAGVCQRCLARMP